MKKQTVKLSKELEKSLLHLWLNDDEFLAFKKRHQEFNEKIEKLISDIPEIKEEKENENHT